MSQLGRRTSWILAIVVVTGVGAMAVRNLDAARVLTELQQVRGAWIILALACFTAILPLWALQWTLLAPHRPHNTIGRMLGVTTMMSSTMNTTPLFLGEAAGLVLLVTRIGVTRAEAVSITIMDQLLVGIAKIGVLTTAALSLTVPDWMRAGWATLVVGVVGLLAICALLAWQHERLESLVSRVLPGRAATAVANIAGALEPLWSPKRGGFGLLLALAKKLAEILAIHCVQRAFGVTLPFASAVLVLAALNLATLLPIVPGNLGVYEGAVVLVYTRLGLTTEHAVSIAILQHACYFVALAVPGYCWAAVTAASRVRAEAS